MVRRLAWLLVGVLWGGTATSQAKLEQTLWGSHGVTVIELPLTAELRLLRTTTTLQPLASLASGIPIAINGGFFNRITQQPLGALRWQGEWWSSPILGRGVFAWNAQGEMRIARLRWLGQVTTPGALPVPVVTLNSGYGVPGVAAYTHHWGSHYTTQSDEEWVVLINANRVAAIYPTLGAGSARFALTPEQWLLTARTPLGWHLVQDLQVGSPVTWTEQMDPPDLQNFPHILGAGPVLVAAGQVVVDPEAERFQPSFAQQRAARSALCLGERLRLVTVGASPASVGESVGVTLQEWATLLQQRGCREALNLDGGSSSALIWQGKVLRSGSPIHNGLGIVP